MPDPAAPPSPPVAVRPLAPADAEAFRSIRLEALRQCPEAFGAAWETESAKPLAWFVQRLESNAAFGAFQAGRLVGLAGFFASDGPKTRHKGHLWGMYVQPAVRGSGVAQALVEAVLAHAAGRVELLQLSVAASNPRALRFYTRMGFEPYGVEKRALKVGDAYLDEILMARFLTPPAAP